MKEGQLFFEVDSKYQNLSLIRNIVRNFLDVEKIEQSDKIHLISVVDELSTNAIEHAYRANEKCYHPLRLALNIDKNTVHIIVEDFGEGFDEEKKSKDEGGLGLNIVKSIVDQFELVKKDYGTKINIIKKIKREETE